MGGVVMLMETAGLSVKGGVVLGCCFMMPCPALGINADRARS
jgi:hypothetical protein